MHNAGIIILRAQVVPTKRISFAEECPVSSFITERSMLQWRLLNLCDDLAVYNCGMVNYKQSFPSQRYLCDIGILVGLVRVLLENNSLIVATDCIKAICSYITNLIKKPRDIAVRQIKLSSSFLQKKIISVIGGLPLFLFGPACFQLTVLEDNSVAIVCVSNLVATSEWIKWLTIYLKFLQSIVISDAV